MDKVKIKMIRNAPGAECGVRVRLYEKGQVYEVSTELAQAFLDNKDAVAVKPPSKRAKSA